MTIDGNTQRPARRPSRSDIQLIRRIMNALPRSLRCIHSGRAALLLETCSRALELMA